MQRRNDWLQTCLKPRERRKGGEISANNCSACSHSQQRELCNCQLPLIPTHTLGGQGRELSLTDSNKTIIHLITQKHMCFFCNDSVALIPIKRTHKHKPTHANENTIVKTMQTRRTGCFADIQKFQLTFIHYTYNPDEFLSSPHTTVDVLYVVIRRIHTIIFIFQMKSVLLLQ